MNTRKILAVLLAGCAASLAACVGARAGNDAETIVPSSAPAVYFLGVDQLPAGVRGEHLAALYSSTPGDRWALTDEARRIATQLGSASIGLDAPIDRWDPTVDPYNFGVISLRGVSHRTLTWKGSNSRTHVSIDLTWLQIGHEQQTRMQRDKLPELRFSVSLFDISEFNSQTPPTTAQLDGYYRAAFTEAASELLRRVRKRYARELDRTAADIRYVIVTSPIVLPAAEQHAAELFGNSAGETHRLSFALGSYLEHRLLERFADDATFDRVVLLPSEYVVDYLQAEWSTFARRVTALSSYSGNLDAIGFKTPRLLQAVPLCTPERDNAVHALELRSNLADLSLTVTPENRHVEWVTITAYLAADVKLALDATRSRQPLDSVLPPLQRHAMSDPIDKPTDISPAEFLGPHTLQFAIAKAVDPLVTDLTARLRETLIRTQPLSHPSYQRFCREP